MTRVGCVSDLHLFCRRSRAHAFQDAIKRFIAASDMFVFNGDTFDFRWSTYPDIPTTVDASIEYLNNVANKYPYVQFQFVLGNHDTVTPFMEALDKFVPTVSNLEWATTHWQIGDHLFLHGDVTDGMMTAADLESYRREWMEDERRGEFRSRIWDAAFGAGIHRVVNRLWFPTDRVLDRIQFHLNEVGLGAGSGVRHVVFGHTHVRVDGVQRDGQAFYNGGAPMPGVAFEALQFDVAGDVT